MKKRIFFTKNNIVSVLLLLASVLLIAGAVVFDRLNPLSVPAMSASKQPADISSQESYVSSDPSSEVQEMSLSLFEPSSTDVTTTDPFTVFSGVSDPLYPLLLNGEPVERGADGSFSVEKALTIGANKFTFSHKGREVTYTVRYRYIVIKSYSPSSKKSFDSGATLTVTLIARKGSTATATFNGSTVTLTPVVKDAATQDEDFITYSGNFKLPGDNTKQLDLGKIKFTAVCGQYTEQAYSGNITCKARVLPTVAEVVAYSAETFNGDAADDASRPTNNYLPKGTVDTVVGRTYYGDKEYLLLRCGRRVYVDKKVVPGGMVTAVTKQYAGSLPDTNKISLASLDAGDRFTTLTFNTDWKAPFFLDVLPQSYKNPAYQNYSVSGFTATYVEITFCYANNIAGNFDLGQYNPVFKSAQIIKNVSGCKLRLYLRKKGGFYGWDASYNSSGQLVFKFLHPAQVTATAGGYGADLSGVRIMIDVGHGGSDPGASDRSGRVLEKERNLALARKLKTELESTGATVILNRNNDASLNSDERCQALKKQNPDLCIAIHHDSNNSAQLNGFGAFYSLPYSYSAARLIYTRTIATGLYNTSGNKVRNRCEWHYYYVARISNCPVVLTENGYMSNTHDMENITNAQSLQKKAVAITKGTVDYFLSIRQNIGRPGSSSGQADKNSSGSSQPSSSSQNSVSQSTSSHSSSSQTGSAQSSSSQGHSSQNTPSQDSSSNYSSSDDGSSPSDSSQDTVTSE